MTRKAGTNIRNEIKLGVTIRGLPTEVKVHHLPPGDIRTSLDKYFPAWESGKAFVISAQTGSGKTRFIHDYVIPQCAGTEKRLLYISSRVAIEVQQKIDLACEVGQGDLVDQLTVKGWRVREEIGGVCILTYHRLLRKLENDDDLGQFDFVVFDEIHALISDALFSPKTGWLLKKLPDRFASAQRIYLSATPDDVLPFLAKAELPPVLPVYQFGTDYSYLIPHYFSNLMEIANEINLDKTDEKWLIFVPSIQKGQELLQSLKAACKLITAKTKHEESEVWERMLAERSFPEKVLLSTSVLDAGVNLCDLKLKNVVSCSSDRTELIQQIGRKRCISKEKVKLYLLEPSEQALRYEQQRIQRNLEAIDLFEDDGEQFIQKFFLQEIDLDIRPLCYATPSRTIEINPLAKERLLQRRDVVEEILKLKQNGGYFAQLACEWLRLTYVDIPDRWLDVVKSEENAAELQMYLENLIEKPLKDEELSQFVCLVRKKYTAAYGPRKGDRRDRSWGSTIINRVLKELNLSMVLIHEKDEGGAEVWTLRKEENK